jgi:hypothetical protein
MTVCAGKLTPQANVEVDTKTGICLSPNNCSTHSLSVLLRPAWWMAKPKGRSSFNLSFLTPSYTY